MTVPKGKLDLSSKKVEDKALHVPQPGLKLIIQEQGSMKRHLSKSCSHSLEALETA